MQEGKEIRKGTEDLADYLDNNWIITHYFRFNIMKLLPSCWTYARFLKRVKNGDLKKSWPVWSESSIRLGLLTALSSA